eukprot:122292-Pleurochrysis_carterae.AAC.1
MRRAGAGRQNCVDWALCAGTAAVPLASAAGGGHDEVATPSASAPMSTASRRRQAPTPREPVGESARQAPRQH